MALRSAAECGGMLDELHARNRIPERAYADAKSMLSPIMAMPTRLVQPFS